MPSPTDAHKRAHLETRGAHLTAQIEALREQALALWRQAQALRNTGADSLPLHHLALDAEEACYRINRAPMAIEDELGEEEDDALLLDDPAA